MKKFTVTVGIPAYNEQNNIENLLVSLFEQKQSSFNLIEVIVYLDASTDNTEKIVKQIINKYPIVKLVKGNSQKGKYHRVNQIFTMSKGDGVVILDADIILVGDKFLENLTHVLIQDPKALLVSAHQKLLRPKKFISKIIYTNFLHWDYVRWSIPGFHSGTNYYGSATAYRGSFARTIKIPADTNDPHLYLYLLADKSGGFRYCRSAEMWQWPISTFQDLKKFCTRSLGKPDATLAKIFGQEHIDAATYVDLKSKIVGTLRCLLTEPFFMPLSLIVLLYVRYASKQAVDNDSRWKVVSSTKQSIDSRVK
jgi:cellulose synthase/poly-beta-1,6-N-acetylglucosamine synthase-like glycosyltransferase